MLVANQKRKENIIEYLLYMFQIEDLIRALDFNIDEIDNKLISQYDEDYNTKREIREWYKSIAAMLKENKLEKSGHIPLLNGLVRSLNDVHLEILESKKNEEYTKAYNICKPAIEELRLKSGNPHQSDIDVCINGLYGLLMLRIQKKKINPDTEKAFEDISGMLAMLSSTFHELERGETEL